MFKPRYKKLVDAQQLLPLVGYEPEMLIQLTCSGAAIRGDGLIGQVKVFGIKILRQFA